jgi:hypothetical protein
VRGAPLTSTTNCPTRIDTRRREISPCDEDFTLLGEETMFGGGGGELDGPVVGVIASAARPVRASRAWRRSEPP